MNGEPLELLARAGEDGAVELLSPAVGIWSGAPPRGAGLEPGDGAGFLRVLSRAHPLLVPAGSGGVVRDEPPRERHAPVGWGEVLLRLEPSGGGAAAPSGPAAEASAGPALRAPQAGRFWRRPEPGAPPFAAEGAALAEGATWGLLEVMKTFQPLKFRSGAGLPAGARIARWLVADGAEVEEGQALAELDA